MKRRKENASSSHPRIYGVRQDGAWIEIPKKDMDHISSASPPPPPPPPSPRTTTIPITAILISEKDDACVVGGIRLDTFSRLVREGKLKSVCKTGSKVYYRVHGRYVAPNDDPVLVSLTNGNIKERSSKEEEEEEEGGGGPSRKRPATMESPLPTPTKAGRDEKRDTSPPLKYLILNVPDTISGIPKEEEERELKEKLGQDYRSELIERRNWMLSCINDNETKRRTGKVSETAFHTNFDYVMRKAISVGGPQGEDYPKDGSSGDDDTRLSDLIDKYSQIFLLKDVVYNPKFEHKVDWITKQEEILLRYVLDRYYADEEKILDLIRTNNVETSFSLTRLNESEMDGELLSECRSLFRTRYYGEEMPTVWLSSPCMQWLEVGLECLKGSTTVVRDGRIYFSYKHLQSDVLPVTTKYVMSVAEDSDRDRNRRLTDVHESKLKVLFGDASSRYSSSSPLSKTSLPRRRTEEERSGIPDIEECADARLLPPCALVHHKKLAGPPHHLKHFERLHHSGFLLDCSYSKDEVREHFRKNFSKGGTDDTTFESEYSKYVERKEGGQWFVGSNYRKDPYGTGCKKYAEGNFNTNSDNVVGCPFVYQEREVLKKFLSDNYAEGVSDDLFDTKKELEDIAERAKEMQQPRRACTMLLGLLITSERSSGTGDPNDNSSSTTTTTSRRSYGGREEIGKRIVNVGDIGNVSCISMNTPQSFFNLRLLGKSNS